MIFRKYSPMELRGDFPIEVLSFQCLEVDEKYHIKPHSHQCYQWYHVLKGKVLSVIDGHPIIMKGGEGVIISPGISRSPRNLGEYAHYLIVGFRNNHLGFEGVTDRLLKCPKGIRGEIDAALEELRHPKDAYSDDLIFMILARITIELIRLAKKEGGQSGTLNHLEGLNPQRQREMVRRVETYIRNNLDQTLTRGKLARVAGISSSHFGRVFRKAVGISPHQCVQAIRVNVAKRMLLESTLSITSIALETGFSSSNHFSAAFKTFTGKTPSEFRKEPGNEPQRPCPLPQK